MADLIIRGMEMPQGCEDCKLRYRHQGAYCVDYCFPLHKTVDPWTFGQDRNGDKPDWCPLLPLPEGHGRLGDLDSILKEKYIIKPGDLLAEVTVVDACYISNAPTVIEAEGGGEE